MNALADGRRNERDRSRPLPHQPLTLSSLEHGRKAETSEAPTNGEISNVRLLNVDVDC